MTHHPLSDRSTTGTHMHKPTFTPAPYLAAAALCLGIAGGPHVHAQSSWTVGQRLDTTQIQALGALDHVALGQKTYRILQTGHNAAGIAYTLVLDQRSRIGQTYHEMQVVQQPTAQVKQQLATLISQAQEVTYYDDHELTLLRFATLAQAADALAQAQAAMPHAAIGVPIVFSAPQLR